jgi:hypothetical protein
MTLDFAIPCHDWPLPEVEVLFAQRFMALVFEVVA